jgi:flagellum-specific peptidoglycan hydrolase FlgJ
MLSLVYRCSTRSYLSLTLTGRCFSTTHHRLEASSALYDTNAAQRLRYATDPEYRAKRIASAMASRRARFAIDPEYHAEVNASIVRK